MTDNYYQEAVAASPTLDQVILVLQQHSILPLQPAIPQVQLVHNIQARAILAATHQLIQHPHLPPYHVMTVEEAAQRLQ